MALFLLMPTFRETGHVRQLLHDLEQQSFTDFHVLIANSNPGDTTSELIAAYDGALSVHEVAAHRDLFWTGALDLALKAAQTRASPGDYCMFVNCDVRLASDFLKAYLQIAMRYPHAQFCPVTTSNGSYVSSGVVMRSWLFSLTAHKLVGPASDTLVDAVAIPVDMLAGRAMLFPIEMAHDTGGLNPEAMPHYGGDYEFSARGSRHGYRAYVVTQPVIELDSRNTGKMAFHGNNTLRQRIAYLWDIRSPLNLSYRIRFVRLSYPTYAIATGILTVVAKTLIEVFLGQMGYRLFRRQHMTKDDYTLSSN